MINFDMSNIKITQLEKKKEKFNFEHTIKDVVFSPQKCMVYKSLFKSKLTSYCSLEI